MTKAEQFLSSVDSTLAEIIQQHEVSSLKSTGNVFHDMMSCIVEQQIHYRSTKRIFHKLLKEAQLEQLHPENFHLFLQHALEGSSISLSKRETALRFFKAWDELHKLPEEVLCEKLMKIKGIGKKTIDMILIYTLEKPDIFSEDDYHIKKAMTKYYGLHTPATIKRKAELWSPYRSVAFKYLLAAK